MEVHLTPELEARLDQLVAETGRSRESFVQDAMEGYFDELAQIRHTLDRRFDDVKSGRVKLIPGETVEAELRERIAKHLARR